MLAATLLGIFLIPPLFVAVERLTSKRVRHVAVDHASVTAEPARAE
jgi:hypothetical protein